MRVLVTGGTGVVGRPAVDDLLERGHTVRLLSRHADQDARDWESGVEGHPADMGDPSSLRGAADGCDAVLHIAGIVAESPPEVTFQKVNVDGTRNLLAEAARAGVRRFVYVSSLGADRGESDYHRSKAAAEELVRGFGGSWLILRPGNVYGPGDEVISLLLKMVRVAPVIPVIGNGEQPFQPIWNEDLGLALAMAVEPDGPEGQALDLSGDEITSTNEVLERLQALTDTAPIHIPVPQWLAQTGAGIAETLGLDLPVNEDQLTMLVEENVIRPGQPNALVDTFGISPTPLDLGLKTLVDSLPERMPDEGRGSLRLHRYWADIRGSRMSAVELLRLVENDFASLPDPRAVEVAAEPGTPRGMQQGETVTLHIPMRGHVQVRVEEVTPNAISAVTLQGHPLSGTVRFLTEELQGGMVRFEVRSYTRPSSLIDQVALATIGEVMKSAMWSTVVEAVVERSGGEAVDGVQTETAALEDEDAAGVEQWVEELVRKRKQRES